MNAMQTQRCWSVPRRLLNEMTSKALLLWIGFTLVVIGIIVAIDRYGDLEQSIWEEASQIPQWFVLFIGIHLAMSYLPLNVTHGKTRRDSAIDAALFMLVFTAIAAILITVGWVIELVVYNLLDLEQSLNDNHIFDAPTEYPLMFLEAWIVLLIWIAGGAFIAASYYRWEGAGLLSILPASLIASLTEFAIGSSWGPMGQVMERALDPRNPPLLVSIAVSIAGLAIMLAMAWHVIRDVAIRNHHA